MAKHDLVNKFSDQWEIIDKEILSKVIPKNKQTNYEMLMQWIGLLPEVIVKEVHSALEQKQPFMSNEVTSDDFLHLNQHIDNCTQIHLLYSILIHSLDCEEYTLTSALIFVVDRISYRFNRSQHLFQISDFILKELPVTPISPQVMLRKARWMKDTGDLHGAMSVINITENKEHRWNYKTEDQYFNVKAVCVQIKGQIYHNLGLWNEAIVPLVESVDLFKKLDDHKGISYSYNLLTRCLSKLTIKEYNSVKTKFPKFFVCNHPYAEGYQLNVDIMEIIKNKRFAETLFTVRHQLLGNECLLMYAKQIESQMKKNNMFQTILSEVKQCLNLHNDANSLKMHENFLEFIKSVFMISQTLSFSNFDQDRTLSKYLEQLCIELYEHICQCKENGKFYQNAETLKYIDGVLTILGLHKLVNADSLISKGPEVLNTTNENKVADSSSSNIKLKSNTLPSIKSPNDKYNMKKFHTVPASLPRFKRDYIGDVVDNFEVFCASDWSGEDGSSFEMVENPHDISLVDFSVISLSKISEDDPSPSKLVGIEDIQIDDPISNLQASINDGSNHDNTDSASRISSSDESSIFSATTTSVFSDETTESDTSSDRDLLPLIDVENPEILQKLEDLQLGSSSSASSTSEYLTNWELPVLEESKIVSRAQVLSYNAVNGTWRSQSTLAYIGKQVNLAEDKKGNFRDVYEVNFLHQDEPLGRYVCKRYRKQKPPVCYMQDVICQMVAGYYVTKFNGAILNNAGTTKLRVQFLPALHLQLLTADGVLSDWVNVEPYLHGTFHKLTNNWSYINNAIEDKFNTKDLATALSHFSYIESKGTLMIVDIQGWLPNDQSGIIYLTDPLFHTCGIDKFSMGDHREDGMRKFWKDVHKSCNSICKFLHLKRPERD